MHDASAAEECYGSALVESLLMRLVRSGMQSCGSERLLRSQSF